MVGKGKQPPGGLDWEAPSCLQSEEKNMEKWLQTPAESDPDLDSHRLLVGHKGSTKPVGMEMSAQCQSVYIFPGSLWRALSTRTESWQGGVGASGVAGG